MSLRVSIITPSFNQGRFLEETLQSVLTQKYPALEYIVIDGGSTDESPAILRRYSDRLSYWCSERDRGQYDALNKGFALATGEIMGWLNSDDKQLPWTLSVVSEIFEKFPEVEWLTSLYPLRWDSSGRAVRCSQRLGFSQKGFLAGENLPIGNWYAPGWLQQESTFWRRSLWDRVGGKLDSQWDLAGDFDLWQRFFQFAELYAVDTPLGGFRQHGEQKSALQKEKYSREAMDLLQRGGGRTPGYLRTSLRATMARSCPPMLQSIAAKFGWLHPCKVCLRRRDETGWDIAQTYC